MGAANHRAAAGASRAGSTFARSNLAGLGRVEFGEGLGAMAVADLLVLVHEADDTGTLLDDDPGALGLEQIPPPHPVETQ